MDVPLLRLLRRRFSLAYDMAEPTAIHTEVAEGIAFGSANLWVLVFAILVASVGLNVNSTAVVIGAMLISPLMGPIVGVGYGAATMDVHLIRRGMKSLLTATGISLLVSAVYFFLSPLSDAGSELLSRTEPTTWDVLIALFGGAAGAVGLTRRERGNVMPGMAIATALMPPVCTAGYGLATGQWHFLFGALYLYCINCVFISLATFVVMRLLALPNHDFVSAAQRRRVQVGVWVVAVLTAVPSVYLAVGIVRRTAFDHNVQQFMNEQLQPAGATLVTRHADADARTLSVLLAGQLTPAQLDSARARLPRYHLAGVQLTVRQGIAQLDSADVQDFRNHLLEDASSQSQQVLTSYNTRLNQLQQLLAQASDSSARRPLLPLPAAPDLLREVRVWNPAVRQLALSRLVRAAADSVAADTTVVVTLSARRPLPAAAQQQLAEWLRQRTGGHYPVRLLVDALPVARPGASQ